MKKHLPLITQGMKTSLNHTKDDRLLLATTSALNHSRSHLMKVIALPTLGFSKPSTKSSQVLKLL